MSRPLPPLQEDELVRVYRETIRPLYAYVARRVGGDASLAEDLVQDTWMRALGSWPGKGLPDEPLAWLVRVARERAALARQRLAVMTEHLKAMERQVSVGLPNGLDVLEGRMKVAEPMRT